MDLKSRLVYQWAKGRIRAIEQYASRAEALQRDQLKRVLSRTARTEFGQRYGLGRHTTPTEFAERTPVQTYEEVKVDVERMMQGQVNVLIPGACRWFAKSSGTTNDKSKFIPVPYIHLHDCHYRGGGDALWIYMRNYPDTRFFSTKGLVLGGSHAPTAVSAHSSAGDLSAILVQHMPALGASMRVPRTRTLLMDEWEAKMEAIVREVVTAKVGSLSGVPSWMMMLLRRVLQHTGAKTISELWPNLEVFFHGGISFEPYREAYRELIGSSSMRYEETYNASEGFFAIQDDPSERGMLLMLDYGIYYEFIPMDALDGVDESAIDPSLPIPLWEVEAGRNYAMLITTLGGLYRYLIGDTVQFVSLNPFRIVITGRTKHFINAFGEELMVGNADKALATASQHTGAQIADYTAAPLFLGDGACGRHRWLIDFEVEPSSLEDFTSLLDSELKALNSDYEAKRYMDMTLLSPEVVIASRGLFNLWLDERGKLGGQHKVPRLANNAKYIDELLALMN
ncbi:MAG: GH3 auxin-responsive promoter family protein [Porphyromonadaceae bacterium]|nr:GH3 auxin-responsive promoter family protein [Porphyromonadaceae bacterium]